MNYQEYDILQALCSAADERSQRCDAQDRFFSEKCADQRLETVPLPMKCVQTPGSPAGLSTPAFSAASMHFSR